MSDRMSEISRHRKSSNLEIKRGTFLLCRESVNFQSLSCLLKNFDMISDIGSDVKNVLAKEKVQIWHSKRIKLFFCRESLNIQGNSVLLRNSGMISEVRSGIRNFSLP